MGCCLSFYDVYDDEQLKGWRSQFEALQLRKNEIGKLHQIFRSVDTDNSGSIGLPEMLALMDVERTAFSERVFSVLDEDGSGKYWTTTSNCVGHHCLIQFIFYSGEIDFREFVLSLWNYCTLSPSTLGLLIPIFDTH